MLSKCIGGIAGLLLFLWTLLNIFGTLDFAKSLVERKGDIMRATVAALTSPWLPLTLLIFTVAVFLYASFGIPSWIWNRDLGFSIPRFVFDPASEELVADVEFFNNGNTRRTVLRVDFVYHTPEMSEWRFRTEFPPSGPLPDSDPKYIDPKQAIVVTYRHHILKQLATEPGNVFGLRITTINKDGIPNITEIDVMFIQEPSSGSLSKIRRVGRISLDVPWNKRT